MAEAKKTVIKKLPKKDVSTDNPKKISKKEIPEARVKSESSAGKATTKVRAPKPTASTAQRIRIRLKAYDHKVIDQSAKQIVDTALRTGATIAGPIPLPTRRSTYTVVKSPHVYKKGREQFEMRVHKRLIDVLDPTPKTIDSLMNLSLPAGCDAEIKMWFWSMPWACRMGRD